jgi:hypothetical protein
LNGPPEMNLLLSCARTSPDPSEEGRIRDLLMKGVNWSFILPWSVNHGIMPLLYINLKKFVPELVPSFVIESLQHDFLTNAAHNIFLKEELVQVLALLEKQGITAVPFKGPVLAIRSYGSLTLRMFSDLDILLRKQDVLKAKELLFAPGYRSPHKLSLAQEKALLRFHSEYGLVQKETRTLVELLWRITPRGFPLFLNLRDLFNRLEKTLAEDKEIWAPAPEDLILFLCIHGTQHAWERLCWICDLAETIRRSEAIDWELVWTRARAYRCERMVRLGLFLAWNLLEAPLPQEIGRKLENDRFICNLATKVKIKLFQMNLQSAGIRELSLFYMDASDCFRDRLAYWLRLLFTPTIEDWELFPFPPLFFFLYYFLHPLRITLKYTAKTRGRQAPFPFIL